MKNARHNEIELIHRRICRKLSDIAKGIVHHADVKE